MSIHSEQVLKVTLYRKSDVAYHIACAMEAAPDRKAGFWKLANDAEKAAIKEYAEAKAKTGP